MPFLAPALLFGLILASAPIIIHLLNRRRFIKVNWAPMRYLKLTIQSNRRRLEIEQWILLALRTLAVIVLVLAVARPVGSGLNLAGMLKLKGRASRVIVIDDSLSMGAAPGASTTFHRARLTAAEIIKQIGSQDSVSVLVTSRPDEPLVRHATLDQPAIDSLTSRMNDLAVTEMGSAWGATFAAVDKELKSAPYPLREVIVLTDLWESGWTPEVSEIADRWADAEVTLRIFEMGSIPSGNRAVESIERVEPVPLIDTPCRFVAKVRVEGDASTKGLAAILSVDGVERTIELPEIAANQVTEIPFTAVFDKPGQHTLSFSLPTDSLVNDNAAYLAVEVRRLIEVALVDGEPATNPFESETDFVSIALTAGAGPWNANKVVNEEWARSPLGSPDVMVLANVESLSKKRVQELEQLVREGMGLLIYPGDQMNVEDWNAIAYRDGEGFLPCKLESSREQEQKGLIIESLVDSPLSLVGRLTPDALSRVRPKRVLGVAEPAPESKARVLARWNDQQMTPAAIERVYGEGKVILWTTTADRGWSDWPTEGSYVLSMRLAAQSVASQVTRYENLVAGQAIGFPLETNSPPETADVLAPHKSEAMAVPIDRNSPAIRYANTARAGVYRASWKRPNGEGTERQFAISPAVRDARPEKLTHERVKEFLGKLVPKIVKVEGEQLEIATAGAELWRYFVRGLVALLTGETLLAAWIDRKR